MNTNIVSRSDYILTFISGLAGSWKAKFDTEPEIAFGFSVKNDVLYLNGAELCPAELVDMKNSYCDVEYIAIALTTGDEIFIHIIWPAMGDIRTYIELIPQGFHSLYFE